MSKQLFIMSPKGEVHRMDLPTRDRHIGVLLSPEEMEALEWIRRFHGRLSISDALRSLLSEFVLSHEGGDVGPHFPEKAVKKLRLLRKIGFTFPLLPAGK